MGDGQRADVVVVGGGIAGGALAVQLAREGVDVLVLEQQLRHRDRVRGETMPPWGYAEVERSGLLPVLLQAEAAVSDRLAPYGDQLDDGAVDVPFMDLGAVLPGVPGTLNLSHPGACEALLAAAAELGARVVRGARRVEVTAGPSPEVRYEADGTAARVTTRMVVGADGRSSSVRRQLGIALQRTDVRSVALGLLVEGLDDWPQGVNAIGTWEDVFYLVFPRQDGRARVYLNWDRSDPRRFAGPDGVRRAMERLATLRCLPWAEQFRTARASGVMACFPFEDTWTDRPYVDGAVLVGDAAGYNDPVIGQGLTIAVRDARLVAQALTSGEDWRPQVFEAYAAERAERMRRLRATAEAMTRLRVDFTPRGREQRRAAFARFAADPAERMPIAASLRGPDDLPPEAFERAACDRMLALT